MSVIGSNILAGASGQGAAGGYEIERSLRFNSADSAYLSRTPGSAGNRLVYTFSYWIKRTKLGEETIWQAGTGSNYTQQYFTSGDQMRFQNVSGGSSVTNFLTNAAFRDVGAWYHIVISSNSSTSLKVYVNNLEQTFSSSVGPVATDHQVNNTVLHQIGNGGAGAANSYIADVHFIDGLALGPGYFGEYDDNGVWQPKAFDDGGTTVNDGTTWSDSVTTADGESTANTFDRLFDGSLSTVAANPDNSGADEASAITFTPASPISYINSVEVYHRGAIGDAVGKASLNDGATVDCTLGQWNTIGTGPGSITKIEMWVDPGTTGIGENAAAAIRVDGIVLLDSTTQTLSYGTNGFQLDFADNSSTTSGSNVGIGKDVSGNGNYFNSNNISVTEGSPFTVYGLQVNTGQSITNIGSLSLLQASSKYFATGATAHNCLTADFGSVGTWSIFAADYLNSGSFNGNIEVSDNGTSWTAVSLGQNPFVFSGRYIQWARSDSGYGGQTLQTTLVGAGNDSLRDSPTNGNTANDTGLGGEVPGNYCTWNPLTKGTYTNGNLDSSNTTSQIGTGTIGVSSGKWYWEVAKTDSGTTHTIVGATPKAYSTSEYLGFTSGEGFGIYFFNGNLISNGSGSGTYGAFSQGDILNVALDMDNGKVWFGKNGTWFNSGNPAAGTNALVTGLTGTYYPGVSTASSTVTCSANFGQRAFANTSVPSGYKALCAANLDDPTIEDGSAYMDVVTYTGNGTSKTISGLEFSPDLVWIKVRDSVRSNFLFDTVRTATKYLLSDTNGDEVTDSTTLTAFNSDGFSVGSSADVNRSTSPIVAWTWDGGSSTVSNTDGSITSQVRANPTAGFSIVSWTGNLTASTVGHGLGGAVPELIIVKNRDETYDWGVYTKTTGNANTLFLNLNNSSTPASLYWNSTSPTSSVFSVGAHQATNNTGKKIIAYCFAPVEGYSAFGSYEGNGVSDGPFIYTGFRPRWLMLKNADLAGTNWLVVDSERNTYNPTNLDLMANQPAGENNYTPLIDFVSNGFKINQANSNYNVVNTYIYAAFAENPFKYARAR